jgi:hypothetical protein
VELLAGNGKYALQRRIVRVYDDVRFGDVTVGLADVEGADNMSPPY